VRSAVDLARVRVARRLVPVDTQHGPSAGEWALAASLHDLIHSLHPGLGPILHRGVAAKLADFAEQVTAQVAPAESLAEVVSRHTFFARLFEISRTDTLVSWWTGSRRFLGTAPPPRLLAWPGLRRVETAETTHPLAELPDLVDRPRQRRFWEGLARILEKLPLTDLATCTREAPRFEWNAANLGLFGAPHSRVVALRALALAPTRAVDAALGRATRPHVAGRAWENVAYIADILAERALAFAVTDAQPTRSDDAEGDAEYATKLGAAVALSRVETLGLSPSRARRTTSRLLPIARSSRVLEPELVQRLAEGALTSPRPRG